MEATRLRTHKLSGVLAATWAGEWLTAGAFLAATLIVGLLIVRELRTAPAPVATPAPAAAGSSVPAEAVSVPALMQGTPEEIKVGDRAADAVARMTSAAVLVREVHEQGPLGPRTVRAYELGGTRFILVLEPFERGTEPRVAAIYLQ
jgi:hypothetical protein